MWIAICDDVQPFAKALQAQIEQLCARKDWPLESHIYTSPKALLKADLSAAQVVFLDVDMPELNGLETAKRLRERYPELLLVFVTAFIEYAPAGYDVSAFRYIFKPELAARLPSCLEDIHERLYTSRESIRLSGTDGVHTVALRDILYIEGTPQRHVLVHLTGAGQSPLECLGLLSEYHERLKDKGFLRIQKSFLANMGHIEDIRNYYACLDSGEKLRVSRGGYRELCAAFLLWEGRQL